MPADASTTKGGHVVIHSGSCACGAVTVEASGDPGIVSMCQCRRRTGSGQSVHVCFARDTVSV
jgi:hypothetical protein